MYKSKTHTRTEMMHELEWFQQTLSKRWLNQCLPDDWNGLDTWAPQPRHKTRVTVRLDSDMVRWFRKTGPGYGARLNAILRVYWTALMSGEVSAYLDENTTPRIKIMAGDLWRQEREGQ